MPTKVVVYEDSGWQRLLPLVYIRAVCQLVCGMGDLLSKVRRLTAAAQQPLELWCRPGLAESTAEQTGLVTNQPQPAGGLFLNGRGLWSALPAVQPGEAAWVGTVGTDIACVYADAALAATLSPAVLLDQAKLSGALAGIPRRPVGNVKLFHWPWELVRDNEDQLVLDWNEGVLGEPGRHSAVPEGSYLVNPNSVHIGPDAKIKPCVVIDAEDGPVWIGRGVRILPHSYVQGPAYIGDNTLLQPGSVVHSGTTIGPRSKVGGEIEASIIQGYSNKQHDGFLGHSYVGSWVNIAADCINSDLKNTYGTIRVPINGREVETGEMFVGMLVGDYSKAGINVSFPTGAVIGFCSSIFAPRSPKFVPSFAWIDGEHTERFDEQRGLAVARKVMSRRDRTMSPAEERAFLAVRQQALAIEHESQRELEGW
jgi:UDP-N-acetylglucosamine diphosphorylase/glucosamine-1-phosphate N-acetyltransferase